MNDITDLFIDILSQHRSIDIADDAFKKMLPDDPELHAAYREWCASNGSSEKNGFIDFCEEYLAEQDSIYDSLSDYNDEYPPSAGRMGRLLQLSHDRAPSRCHRLGPDAR